MAHSTVFTWKGRSSGCVADTMDAGVHPFVVNSYQCMLLGLDYLRPLDTETTGAADSDDAARAFADVAARASRLATTLPGHRSYSPTCARPGNALVPGSWTRAPPPNAPVPGS